MKFFIQTPKGYVTGFDHATSAITYTKALKGAKLFKSKGEMNSWLDQYVGMGYGLVWADVRCFQFR